MKYFINENKIRIWVHYTKKDRLKSCGGVNWNSKKYCWDTIIGREFLASFMDEFNLWGDKILYNLFLQKGKELEFYRNVLKYCKHLRDNPKLPTPVDDFNVRVPMYDYQKICVYALINIPRFGLLLPPGTGKSKIIIDSFSHRITNNEIKNIVVVCPKINIHRTWVTQLDKHYMLDADITPIDGITPKLKKQQLDRFGNGVNIHIMTYACVRDYSKYLQKYDMVIFDESRRLGSTKSARTQKAKDLSDKAKFAVIATGTCNTLKSFSDVFSQYYVLDGGETFGINFTSFRKKFFVNVGDIYPDWKMRSDTIDQVGLRMYNKAITYKKDACIDLPGKTVEDVYVPMLPLQNSIMNGFLNIESGLGIGSIDGRFKELLENNGVNFRDEVQAIMDAIPLAKHSKLRQISCGHYRPFTVKDKILSFEPSKLGALVNILDTIPDDEKVVIWAGFTHDIELIADRMGKEERSCCKLYGKSKYEKELEKWATSDDCKILIGQERLGIGLNELVKSHYVIYYSYSTSLDDFKQSMDRTYRIGQKFKVTYYMLVTQDTIDLEVLKILKSNKIISNKLAATQYKNFIKNKI